ncbi:hypothetical protein HPB48_007942 [Haemaphysalis longicornis]|uniref:DDE Tnp4 domain-containing protein n=1 Tax=Haemaphysalis longicornis TaxID=44386 RepID=A0A9J6FC45_HAELO|nr:hypothetical protein HPB48_007942 [Haemaphysalis longicornis]
MPLDAMADDPIRGQQACISRVEKNCNRRCSQQRGVIENAFGLLKQRFRRLYFVGAETVEQSCYIVMAACELHNLCNDERDFLQEPTSVRQGDMGNNDCDGEEEEE